MGRTPAKLTLLVAIAAAWVAPSPVAAQAALPWCFTGFHPGEVSGNVLLPEGDLFCPLIADPKAEHSFASYLRGDFPALREGADPDEDLNIGSVGLAETLPIIRFGAGERGNGVQVGLTGSVFAQVDLSSESFDLINADYLIGVPVSFRAGAFSTRLRVYHQSSHLGDEFLLRNRVDRVNLSYEGVDLLVSADLHPALRIYLGGGAIVHDEPQLDPWSGQVGIEVESPVAFFGGVVRPVAAGDFQFRQENDWRDEISGVAGIQIENPEVSPLRLLILAEYFRGNSPNGQFFERRIEYVGVGAHLHF